MPLNSPSPILVFYGERYRLIGLAPLLPFLGPWAHLLLVSLNWPVGPYFFPFFLLGFYSPLFFPLLTNLFFHFSFACYWAFLLLGSFYQKWVSTCICTQKLQALEKYYFTYLIVLTANLLLWYSSKKKKKINVVW